ncbi:MAG TPA: hypothetical protein VFZ20_23870, partial [Longimicrobium sp.]
VSNADFQIAFVPDPTAGGNPQPPYQASVDAQVTILGNNAWNCAPAARQALMQNWIGFWQQVESKLEQTGVLIPGATTLLAQQTAEIMPAPLQESLFYRFSLLPGFASGTLPYVDVQPGMQLRVEFESSQFTGPGGPTNGYLGASQYRWAVQSAPASGGGRVTVFDSFLGTVSAPTVAVSASPVAAGGLPDLQAAGTGRKYVRLCLPQAMPAGTDPGSLGLTGNAALLGASTLTDLEAATTAYLGGTCAAGAATPGVTCTVFRGRAAVVPEIAVWLQLGANAPLQLQYVPVGTTVANLVERVTTWRMLGYAQGTTPVTLSRPVTTATGQQFVAVQFSPVTLAGTVMDPRALDLPLVKGDRLLIQLAQ